MVIGSSGNVNVLTFSIGEDGTRPLAIVSAGFSRLLACRPKASTPLRKALRALLVTDKKMPTFQWAFWFGGDEGSMKRILSN